MWNQLDLSEMKCLFNNLSSNFTWRSTIPVMHRTTVMSWHYGISSHYMRILSPFCMQLPHVCLIWLKYSEWLNLNQSPAGQLMLRLGLWYLDNSKGCILMQPEVFRPYLYPWLLYCDFQNTACTRKGWGIKMTQGVAGLKSSISGIWVGSSLSLHVVRAPVG